MAEAWTAVRNSKTTRRCVLDYQSAGRLDRKFVAARRAVLVPRCRYWSPRQRTSCASCGCSLVLARSGRHCPSPMKMTSPLRRHHDDSVAVVCSWVPSRSPLSARRLHRRPESPTTRRTLGADCLPACRPACMTSGLHSAETATYPRNKQARLFFTLIFSRSYCYTKI